MPQNILQFAITVLDYDEAIEFYVNKLGFELLEDTDLGNEKRWVRVRPPGLASVEQDDSKRSGILLARAVNDDQRASVGRQTGGRVFVFIETDDFQADYDRLVAAGVRFVRPPEDQPWGRVAVFADLYGNLFDLIGARQT